MVRNLEEAWSEASTGARIVLSMMGVTTALVSFLLIGTLADSRDAFSSILVAVMAVIAVGLQVYFARRVVREWDSMSDLGHVGLGVAAVVAPPAIGFLGPLVLGAALVLWLISIFSADGPGGSGTTSARRPAATGFGSWWGDAEVVNGADGRPRWVGGEEVLYGSDGRPIWVGDREVLYGGDGRPAWIGDDQVIFGSGKDTPGWIGDSEVR